LEAVAPELYAALRELFPRAAILQRNQLPARRGEGLVAQGDRWVHAPDPDAPPWVARFTERGLDFELNLKEGQKTGFYFDQRDSRALVEELVGPAGAEGGSARCLDLFAYVGAFSLAALRGGAGQVVAVESASRLAATAHALVARNGLAADRLDWQSTDVFEWLRAAPADARFDLVVCDPPPLVKRKGDVDAGARAYKDLNRLALTRLAPGGLLLTFTCSAGVDAKLFRQVLWAASRESAVDLQLLRPLGAALDHPVAIGHLEGEYLKGWLCRRAV
jgi:23S rRNA (cytosine1962-C5)-methyltransferase